MIIVGQITTQEEAQEIELITKIFIVGSRARLLAHQNKKRKPSYCATVKEEREE